MKKGTTTSLAILLACAGLLATGAARATNTTPVQRPLAVLHTVAQLDHSVAFYHGVLGLPLDSTPVLRGGGSALQRLIGAPGAVVKAVSLSIPGSELHLVLLQIGGIARRHAHQRLQDPGAVKLVLRVRDIDRAFQAARPHLSGVYSTGGAPVHPEGPDKPIRAVVMRDPDGFALEFVLASEREVARAPRGNIVGGWASLITQDEQQALAFYRSLGFRVLGGRALAPSVLALEGTPSAKVMLTAARPPGTSFVWFFYDFRDIQRTPLDARLSDVGCSAVAFLVDDLPRLLETLSATGTSILSSGRLPVSLGDGTQAAFVRDPSGTPVEFVQTVSGVGGAR